MGGTADNPDFALGIALSDDGNHVTGNNVLLNITVYNDDKSKLYEGIEAGDTVSLNLIGTLHSNFLWIQKQTVSANRVMMFAIVSLNKARVFGSFGLSTKEPYTIMLCPSSSLASSCISISIGIIIIICAHLPLAHG